jgi:uncharacterized integral membrane protein
MYFSLALTVLLLLAIVITSLQNSMPLNLKFITWNLQMPLTALILYSSLIGGAIVAVLALSEPSRQQPRLAPISARQPRKQLLGLLKLVMKLGHMHLRP